MYGLRIYMYINLISYNHIMSLIEYTMYHAGCH